MSSKMRSIAEGFVFYGQLGWFGRWNFRHFLQWISRDAISLELLLDFDRRLAKTSLSSGQIADIMVRALIWYNREDHYGRIKNRIEPGRLPEMLQIVLIFLERSHDLHHSYRQLVIDIIHASDDFGRHDEVGSGVTPEQFQVEAAKAIANLSQQWGIELPYLKREADRILGCLANVTQKASDSQLFTAICRDIAPLVGIETISYLIDICKDPKEFQSFSRRITTQMKWWGRFPGNMFRTPKTISELHRSLVFLETLSKDARAAEYMRYVPTDASTWKSKCSFVHVVRNAYFRQAWKRTSEWGPIIEDVYRGFEEEVVRDYLRETWHELYASTYSRYSGHKYKIRWEFDKFTEYIPYKERTQDWTGDNDRIRRYWNWRDAESRELLRFFDTFKPKLRSLFRTLTLPNIEMLFSLFPGYLSTQEFKKEVYIPVAWNRSVEIHEGYSSEIHSEYREKVEVARPKEYVKHVFTFERPYLQDAIDLLENVDKVREIVQAHRGSGR